MVNIEVEDKVLFSVSNRAKNYGFVFPVMILQDVWKDYYMDNDSDMLWVEDILDACASQLTVHRHHIDVEFSISDREGKSIDLKISLEFDDNMNPYILVQYPRKLM
ncbi:MAG: hypothetical protein ACRBCI_00770 [Cellvibrionaceae bacterium]